MVVASPEVTASVAATGAKPSASMRTRYDPGATSANANAPSSAASVVPTVSPASDSSVIVAAATGLSAACDKTRPSRRPARGAGATGFSPGAAAAPPSAFASGVAGEGGAASNV